MNFISLPLVAAVSGEQIVSAVIWVVCLGVVFGLLKWLINYINPDEPFKRVANIVLVVAAVIVLINVILALSGHPLIKW